MSKGIQRTELTLEQVHSKELEILKYFIGVCKDHNLQYFLIAGSLLGAIRHKGFIPWDDDIDVGMLREDYDKLSMILRNTRDKRFFWQDDMSQLLYPLNYGKICINNTFVYEEYYEHIKMHRGIFIDIFPIDYCADSNVILALEFKLMRALGTACIFKSEGSHRGKIPRLYIQLICNMISYLPFRVIKMLRRFVIWVFRCLSSKKRVCFFGSLDFHRMVYLFDWLEHFETASFEGLNVQIPKEWDAILKTAYGDYMTPPPVECRQRHFIKAEILSENV